MNIISIIVFFFISNIVFKTNILNDFMNTLKETMNLQISMMQKSGISLGKGFNVSDILNYINNILPTILVIQSMLVTFIVYGVEVFILRRIKIVNLPKFTDFNLPGKPVGVFFVLYLLILVIDLIKVDYLHTDLILLNLQLVFNFMFMIQGISVSIYYLKKWIRSSSLKMVFISVLFLSIFGFTIVCFVGMLDSIIDFRRIRSYKST